MLRYKDLTPEQKKFICNGCGGKGGWIKPPNFLFRASCNHHDFLYYRGMTDEDRQVADDSFYKWMKKDVAEAAWYKRLHYGIWAYVYYKAVVISGKKYFSYRDNYATIEQLKQEMSSD